MEGLTIIQNMYKEEEGYLFFLVQDNEDVISECQILKDEIRNFNHINIGLDSYLDLDFNSENIVDMAQNLLDHWEMENEKGRENYGIYFKKL